MTTEDNESAVIPEVLKQNIETLEELNQRFVSVLQNKKTNQSFFERPWPRFNGQSITCLLVKFHGKPSESDGKADFVLG